MKNKELANYPWVFWITIRWRPKWFKFYWKTRCANAVDIQFWKFNIGIGRPWLKGLVDAHQRDYGSSKYVHQTNLENRKIPISFTMPPPKNNSY